MNSINKKTIFELIKYIGLSNKDVLVLKEIHQGFTNQSYFLETKNHQKYQIRIGHNNEIVNRNIEALIVHNFLKDQFLHYNEKNGNAIKKWIEGRDLKKSDLNINIIEKLVEKIEILHQTDLENLEIDSHDYFMFLDKNLLETKHYLKYKDLINDIKDKKDVLSHNDLNLKNILINEKEEIFFIDFEWARINYWWWDYANFIREVNLSKKMIQIFCKYLKIKFNEMLKYLYICTNFALQWSYKTKQSKKILAYQAKTIKILEKYYRWLIKSGMH